MRRHSATVGLTLILAAGAARAAADAASMPDMPTLVGGAAAGALAVLAWSRKFLKGWSADGATIETIQLLREEVTRLSGVNAQLAQEVGRLHDQNIRLQGEIESLHRRLARIDTKDTVAELAAETMRRR